MIGEEGTIRKALMESSPTTKADTEHLTVADFDTSTGETLILLETSHRVGPASSWIPTSSSLFLMTAINRLTTQAPLLAEPPASTCPPPSGQIIPIEANLAALRLVRSVKPITTRENQQTPAKGRPSDPVRPFDTGEPDPGAQEARCTSPSVAVERMSHPWDMVTPNVTGTGWKDWVYQVVEQRRDSVWKGKRTMIILQGPPAVGKTTVARCLARQHGIAVVDTDPIKRGIGITQDHLPEHTPTDTIPVPSDDAKGKNRYRWEGALASASLAAVLLAAELMDQGFDTVVAGLDTEWLSSISPWTETIARLVSPHHLFPVRLDIPPEMGYQRLRQRPGHWRFPPKENRPPRGERLTINTTGLAPSDIADAIIRQSPIATPSTSDPQDIQESITPGPGPVGRP